ncbi:MAG: hypothetical protein QHI38_06725 [Armatimonadota bacterium]|nr:hypothetical protein [Armatimonadota bacterium]
MRRLVCVVLSMGLLWVFAGNRLAAEPVWEWLPSDEVGIELYIGEGSEIVILPSDANGLFGKAVIYTGSACDLRPDDVLVFTATEIFTGRVFESKLLLGRTIEGGKTTEVPVDFSFKDLGLVPGYYWITCDLRRNGRSLAGGRVGFEDFYIQKPQESMLYSVLSFRLGMGLYIIDPTGGYGAGGSASLLHTYDPRNADYYTHFIRSYKGGTYKHSEGLEAGVTGTVFAAYAFRVAGDLERARFAERLIKSNCDYMLKYMQLPDGGTLTISNAYLESHPGEYEDRGTRTAYRDTNQVGEWIRPIARAILYLQNVPGEEAYVAQLYRAARRAADFLVRVGTDQIGGRKHVIRHYYLYGMLPDVKRKLYYQEGRQCDVYVPRAMAGLAYFAYAMQLREGRVPEAYLAALRDTTEWALEKMQPDTGWFDWQCGYEVEGGCHAILGNLYLAEAAQGYYLLCKARGDEEGAKLAAECARRALHFITDHERGGGAPHLEFWLGPYLYWQFTEYLGSIGEDAVFRNYIVEQHRRWSEQRGWRDFTKREGKGLVFRADDLSHLTMSITAYPALRLMEELGKPFRWFERR